MQSTLAHFDSKSRAIQTCFIVNFIYTEKLQHGLIVTKIVHHIKKTFKIFKYCSYNYFKAIKNGHIIATVFEVMIFDMLCHTVSDIM